MNKSNWKKQFNLAFAVPAEVEAMVARGELCDTSYGNDACPTFINPRDDEFVGPVLWCDHPDRSLREEQNGKRFFVTTGTNAPEFKLHGQTDDVADAITLFKLISQKSNPRFVMVIGSIRELYPDIPESVGRHDDLVIWDRQEGFAAATFSRAIAQMVCLEHRHHGTPFTDLVTWMNELNETAMTSESMTPTRPEFFLGFDDEHSLTADLQRMLSEAKDLIPDDVNERAIEWHQKLEGFGI